MRILFICILLACSVKDLNAQLRISKLYPTPKRSVPLQILNCPGEHFYMLRYNKMAHDITIERRRKSDGGINTFAALKMDSVNASWFSYDELDHLFFEKNGLLFFVFERVLNKQSRIYMKAIDSLGRTSGFIVVSTLEMRNNESRLSMDFQLTENKLLKISKLRQIGASVYREVELYDPIQMKILLSAALPVENSMAAVSGPGTFGDEQTFYYPLFMLKPYQGDPFYVVRPGAWTRPGIDSVALVALRAGKVPVIRKNLPVKGLRYVHMLTVSDTEAGLLAEMMCTVRDSSGGEHLQFMIWKLNKAMEIVACNAQELDVDLKEKLTFYDGSLFDEPAGKEFFMLSGLIANGCRYHFMERGEYNFRKEILMWRSDSRTAMVDQQCLIPRKFYYSPERGLYRTLGTAMQAKCNGNIYTFLLEHRRNAGFDADKFSYHDFIKQESSRGANLAAYILRPDGRLEKKIIYQNRDYNCIPLRYSGETQEMIFYLTKNEGERFAVLELNRF